MLIKWVKETQELKELNLSEIVRSWCPKGIMPALKIHVTCSENDGVHMHLKMGWVSCEINAKGKQPNQSNGRQTWMKQG